MDIFGIFYIKIYKLLFFCTVTTSGIKIAKVAFKNEGKF